MKKMLLLLFSAFQINLFAQEEGQLVHYLQEVFVDAPVVYQKGDTLVYRAEALTSKNDRALEDILKRIPGVNVDSDGTIRYNGKSINNFYIEELDLLSSRYSLATQRIKPEDIQNIEVLENHQHIRMLKGVSFSNRAAINIRLKKSRLSRPIGYVQAGIGTEGNDFEDIVGAQVMNISKANQYLVTAGQRAHWSIESKIQNLFDASETGQNAVFSPFEETIIRRPDIPIKRYLDNDNIHAQANVMRKTKHNNEIRFIAEVSSDRDCYTQSQNLDYYSDGNLVKEITEYDSDTRKKKAQMQFRLERNLDSLYIKHNSTLIFSQSLGKSMLDAKGQQDLREGMFAYYGTLSMMKKTRKNIFRINGALSIADLPASMEYKDMRQDYETSEIKANISSGYQYYFNRDYSIGVNAAVSANKNRLTSEFSEAVHSGSVPALENDCRLFTFSVKAEPFFQIKKTRSELKISVPVEYDYIKGDNRKQDIDFTKNPLNIGVDIRYYTKLTPIIRLVTDISHSRWQGSVSELAVAPILTSYIEQNILGTGRLSSHDRDLASVELIYRHPITGLNINIQSNFQRLGSDLFSGSYYVDGSFNNYTANVHNNTYAQQNLVTINENLFDIEWVLSLNGLYVYRKGKTMQLDKTYQITSPMYSLSFKSEKFFFNRHVSLENSISYTHNESSYKQEDGTLTNNQSEEVMNNKNRLNFSFAKKWFFTLSSESQWRKSYNWHPNHYVDASIRWKTKKHEIELCGNNLTNNSMWTSSLYRGLNTYYFTYSLRTLEIMVNYKYSF